MITKIFEGKYKEPDGKIFIEELELQESFTEEDYKKLLKEFNEEEIRRYGKTSIPREFVNFQEKGKGKMYCNFVKSMMAQIDSRGRIYDLMECTCCKKRIRRYGLDQTMTFICKGENYYQNSYRGRW